MQEFTQITGVYPSKMQNLKLVSCTESIACNWTQKEKTPALPPIAGYIHFLGNDPILPGPELAGKNAIKSTLFAFPQPIQSKPHSGKIAFFPSISQMFHVEHFAKSPPTPHPPFPENAKISVKNRFFAKLEQIFSDSFFENRP